MVAETVRLTCPGCGAKIEVTEDLSRFACAYCGNEVLVNRAGGAVSLIPVLEEVRDGAARTASELAIKRLSGDIEKLLRQREPVAKDVGGFFGDVVLGVGGILAVVAGVWMLVQNTSYECFGWPLVLGGFLGVAYFLGQWAKVGDARTELERLDTLIKDKRAELDRHNEIVKG